MIDIKSAIPHREPFLFVDEIVSISQNEIVAKKTFRIEDNSFYRGHYPAIPITPGVILCESVFQAAAVLLSQQTKIDVSNQLTDNIDANYNKQRTIKSVPVLSKIESARFKSVARPGEQLQITVNLLEQIGKFSILTGVIKKTGHTTVLKIKFTLGYADLEK